MQSPFSSLSTDATWCQAAGTTLIYYGQSNDRNAIAEPDTHAPDSDDASLRSWDEQVRGVGSYDQIHIWGHAVAPAGHTGLVHDALSPAAATRTVPSEPQSDRFARWQHGTGYILDRAQSNDGSSISGSPTVKRADSNSTDGVDDFSPATAEDDMMSKSGDANDPYRDEFVTMQRKLTKKRAQNRACQRAYRERRIKHIIDLQEKLEKMETVSQDTNAENKRLKMALDHALAENELLRSLCYGSDGTSRLVQNLPTVQKALSDVVGLCQQLVQRVQSNDTQALEPRKDSIMGIEEQDESGKLAKKDAS